MGSLVERFVMRSTTIPQNERYVKDVDGTPDWKDERIVTKPAESEHTQPSPIPPAVAAGWHEAHVWCRTRSVSLPPSPICLRAERRGTAMRVIGGDDDLENPRLGSAVQGVRRGNRPSTDQSAVEHSSARGFLVAYVQRLEETLDSAAPGEVGNGQSIGTVPHSLALLIVREEHLQSAHKAD